MSMNIVCGCVWYSFVQKYHIGSYNSISKKSRSGLYTYKVGMHTAFECACICMHIIYIYISIHIHFYFICRSIFKFVHSMRTRDVYLYKGPTNAEALRATAKGEDDEWDEQDDEALVGEGFQQPPKTKGGGFPRKKGFSPGQNVT